MTTECVLPSEEEYEAEGKAKFPACATCGAAFPHVDLLLKSDEEFHGHVFIQTRCARCDEEYATVLHFCPDVRTCQVAEIELSAVDQDKGH